jgi:glycosyltransferase involved in cell wall biosynthesis
MNSSPPRPLVSILLIAFNQETVIADAVRAALAQTYEPLEILISDDSSRDRTFEIIEATVRNYAGPHRVWIHRNEQNLGISGHLSALALRAQGELLFVAAGDDVSTPERCARVVDYWIAHECRPDLIATDLVDMDDAGQTHERIAPAELDTYRGFDDWLAQRPHLIGAAHTWSRRLFDRFGPLMAGAMAEDQLMTFRAIVSGGALSLREPLVRYRRGGLSRKRRYANVAAFIERMRLSNHYALAEVAQLQQDADIAGLGARMREHLAPKLARERYTQSIFEAKGLGPRIRLLLGSPGVKAGFRIRMFFYAACPAVYAPVFWLKRAARGARS